MSRERIAGIVLAAGASTRLGRPKQLLEWKGRPLIAHAAHTAIDAGLEPVVVVIGHQAEATRAGLASVKATIVENPRWPEGMSTSLQAGLSALPDEIDGAIFLLVDQPRIGSDHLRAMMAAYRASGKSIVVTAYRGRIASPTLFDRALFDRLRQVTGDVGGRSVIRANLDRVEAVEVEDELTLLDVDTLEDWQRIGSGPTDAQ